MPSSVNWPVTGGPTAHPTGVTLASDDPPKSLNAPGGSPGCLLAWEAQQPGLWLGHGWFLGLAAVISAAARSRQGSDRQNGPPCRIGSSEEAFCLAVSVELENRDLLPHNRDTSGSQVVTVAVVR